MTTQELVGLIATGREHEFYTGSEWKKLAAKVRAYDRNECQHCKAAGRYARGEIVHHVKHLKERPDLALLMFDPDTGERQLITICKACHEKEHPEALQSYAARENQAITQERWD